MLSAYPVCWATVAILIINPAAHVSIGLTVKNILYIVDVLMQFIFHACRGKFCKGGRQAENSSFLISESLWARQGPAL